MILHLCMLLSIIYTATGSPSHRNECEPITIPECRSLPYNLTRFPNSLDHDTQLAASKTFNSYKAFLATNCSAYLVFFLCTMIVPICVENENLTHPIKPCRSVCERVKSDCMPTIRSMGRKWPSGHCDSLPEISAGVCVAPDSFVSQNSLENCDDECKKLQLPADYKSFNKRKLDFAYKVTLKQIRVNMSGETVLKVKVFRKLFRSSRRIPPKANIKKTKIWNNITCNCLQLKVGKVYFLAGNYNKKTRRLVLNGNSFITEWKRGIYRQIKNWQTKRN